MKKIAIITVTYNTHKDTLTLLSSLEKIDKQGLDLEIIIVDNGSETIFDLPERYKNEKTFLIRLEPNVGFTGGYNRGMREALTRGNNFILIINNDTVVDPKLIKNLLTILESKPQIGVTTPKIYFAKGHEFHKEKYKEEELGKVIWFAGGYTDWNNVQSIHRGVDEVDHGQYDKTEKIDFATGCCMLFKREVLEKVGVFDERYFLYYEDADLNERIKRAGFDIYYVPTALLTHVNASSTGGAGNVLHDYYLTRNKMLFGLTYAPIRTKVALIRESTRLLFSGRPYQKLGIQDFYLGRFNKGSFCSKK